MPRILSRRVGRYLQEDGTFELLIDREPTLLGVREMDGDAWIDLVPTGSGWHVISGLVARRSHLVSSHWIPHLLGRVGPDYYFVAVRACGPDVPGTSGLGGREKSVASALISCYSDPVRRERRNVMNVDKTLERVRKLLAKARDSSVTEEEAALFAAKAQEILQELGMSAEDLPESEREDGVEKTEHETPYAEDPWRKSIARSAARLYFCEMILSEKLVKKTARKRRWSQYDARYVESGEEYSDLKKVYTFVGRPHNTVVAREMTEYLIGTVCRLAREYSSVRRELIAFERGCGERLASRLDELRVAQLRSQRRDRASSGSTLPALYDSEQSLVEKFVREQMPSVYYRRTPGSSVGGDHAAAGASAANGVSLAGQVGRGGSVRRALS